MEGALLFFWLLVKMFHQPLLNLFMENIRLWIMLARFLCLSGFRIRSTVAEAQEMLTAEHTCFLLVSLRSVLSHHEYPAEGMGKGYMKRVSEQKMLEIKQSTGGSRELFPTM